MERKQSQPEIEYRPVLRYASQVSRGYTSLHGFGAFLSSVVVNIYYL